MKKMLSTLLLATSFLFGAAQADDKPANMTLKMATTTSTENSGLLADLLPKFEKKSGYSVQVIAVGTGKALKMGEDGDVDVVLVHAPAAEKEFVEKGFGDQRYPVMYNDFILLGPDADPAGARDTKTTPESLAKIAEKQAIFVSRGDDSGTHKKELKLWETAGVKPQGDWYREAGQGMGKVIQMAGELEGYTLADRGTWLASMGKSPLKIVHEGDKDLLNPYGVIAVSQKRYPDINHTGAQAFIDWLVSAEGQQAIGDFKINDTALFTPNADSAEAKPAADMAKEPAAAK
ncbi:MAG: substrate-binding domain-containing protein [Gammaproteobacteria bacterium]|nr:substrate-binding domain-containing protein [Gammaproteobacteria bacterium]